MVRTLPAIELSPAGQGCRVAVLGRQFLRTHYCVRRARTTISLVCGLDLRARAAPIDHLKVHALQKDSWVRSLAEWLWRTSERRGVFHRFAIEDVSTLPNHS